MPVNLSIKNAPDQVVQRLRQRAERHHRSLQGELLAIIEAAVQDDHPATAADILAEVRRLGSHTPTEAALWFGLTAMAAKVIDASALAALLFGEPEGDLVAVGLEDATLIGPTLLGFEVANVCRTKTRRQHEQAQKLTLVSCFRNSEVNFLDTNPLFSVACCSLKLQDISGAGH